MGYEGWAIREGFLEEVSLSRALKEDSGERLKTWQTCPPPPCHAPSLAFFHWSQDQSSSAVVCLKLYTSLIIQPMSATQTVGSVLLTIVI